MKKILIYSVAGASLLLLSACSEPEQSNATKTANAPVKSTPKVQNKEAIERWYGFSQVLSGGKIFQENCASCHKKDASGTTDWKKTDAQGRYPAPPLNGNAHAWHHPMTILVRTVKNGGAKLGGWMPGFKDKLSDQEILSAIAWIQTHWSDERYRVWHSRDQQSGKPISAIKN